MNLFYHINNNIVCPNFFTVFNFIQIKIGNKLIIPNLCLLCRLFPDKTCLKRIYQFILSTSLIEISPEVFKIELKYSIFNYEKNYISPPIEVSSTSFFNIFELDSFKIQFLKGPVSNLKIIFGKSVDFSTVSTDYMAKSLRKKPISNFYLIRTNSKIPSCKSCKRGF